MVVQIGHSLSATAMRVPSHDEPPVGKAPVRLVHADHRGLQLESNAVLDGHVLGYGAG